jgi:uncharacterized membrane protein (DUF2068 family)
MLNMSKKSNKRILHLIAIFEAVKGFLAIASALGILSLIHHDVRHLALELIGHFGADPHQHYPLLILQAADYIAATPTASILIVAFFYAGIRLTEAVGIWLDKSWGEWVAALSGGLYIPFELKHLINDPSVISLFVFLFNCGIVIFMILQLKARRAIEQKE